MIKFISSVLLGLFLFVSYAKGQSSSQVFVLDMVKTINQEYRFSNPQYLTSDNRAYYNNQPFLVDSLLFMTASVDTTQTDLWLMDLNTRKRYRLTRTAESEYSPTLKPGSKFLTYIRVSADGNNTQQLWQTPLDFNSEPSLVMDRIKDIGYHTWLSDSLVILFIVGNPHQLSLYDISTQRFEKVASNIGRCFRVHDGELYYVDKSLESLWVIRNISFTQRRPTLTIKETIQGSEDFAITPDGVLIMGKGSKLYRFIPNKDQEWVEIGSLEKWGIRNISRISLHKGKIALVSSP